MMQNSDLELDKYWATKSGYFRLETEAVLGMGIAKEKPLFYHEISEGSVDKKVLIMEYNDSIFMTASIIPFQMTVVDKI